MHNVKYARLAMKTPHIVALIGWLCDHSDTGCPTPGSYALRVDQSRHLDTGGGVAARWRRGGGEVAARWRRGGGEVAASDARDTDALLSVPVAVGVSVSFGCRGVGRAGAGRLSWRASLIESHPERIRSPDRVKR
jgi:hypothetical protein